MRLTKQSLARIRELEGQLASLKTETETLRGQKRDQEPRREGIAAEAKQIGEKRKGWCSRVLELEATLKDKENENSVLLKKLNENENIFTSKIVEIKAQVKELMDQKTELKVQLERKTAEILDNLVQIESLTEELARKVLAEKKMEGENQASLQREREIVLTKKNNLQSVEKKIKDLAEKFQTSLEHKLRLLYLRILVTEQLHTENKESYKLTKERHEKGNRELEEKIKSHESELRKMKEVSELAEYALNGLDLVVRKFEEENGNFLTHISKVSNEIQFAKTWVTGTSGEIKRLKQNLDDKEEQEFLLRDKVWKLEAEMSKEGGEKLNLIQAISQLEKKLGKYERQIKDKDERLLSLGDEKREAIRQLCILVDYHRGRFDHLKQVVSKIRPKMRAY